ncbi:MAG TPA: LPXTG cell wall anchor domain-containing protein [Firmicutes bacterium]|nr:LPXTG cell wall anchor domain-containing protein [Bacillota bacterium]
MKSLKRFLSVTLSAALLCGLAVSGVSADDAAGDTAVRPTVTLVESGFEDGLEAPFSANESDDGKAATITPVSLEGEVNPYLHLTDRTPGSPSSTVMQNVLTQLKANGADGKYYISARIKLDTEGDTAYVDPMIQGAGSLQLRPLGGEKRFAVTNEWTTVGQYDDGSYVPLTLANGTFNADSLEALTWAKFYFRLFTTESGAQTAYDGDYSLDDVTLWFVPNEGAPEKVTTVGENILSDGTFDAHLSDPDYYNTQKAAGDSWYVATSNDESTGTPKVTATVDKEGDAAGEEYIHTGTGALHITNRPGAQQSIAVNLKDAVDRVGQLAKGEHYYISVWVRAEEGETIRVQPIFGSSLATTMGNGYILPRDGGYVEVTDEWTEVGIDVSGEYLPFLINGSADAGNCDPYGATWASIRLATEDTASFYVDDFKVMGPQPVGDAVEAFLQAVEALPAPADITRSDEGVLTAAEGLYAGLALDALTEEQAAAVEAAKATLDAARAAFDALPAPKNSFVPEYTYDNPANLIAPYGDLESFGANDFIWNEENSEGVPTYTLVTDPAVAHKGNNCLLISGREKIQHGAAYTLTDVVKDNGGGKYYFSCWMRTKNPGDEMDVFPLLYIGGQGKEFYIDNDTRYHITNEWTYVGVTYDNIEGYYRSNGEEIPDLDDTATYVALRFYGQNEMWESEEDGAIYPDYYIDDLKVWKYFDGQEEYVDPDAPAGGDPSGPSDDPDVVPGGPETGETLPLALPVLGILSLGALAFTRKRK